MEIKRRLNKIAKCITPQLEAMNIAYEMNNLCSRLEDLVSYGDEKIARAAERVKNNEKTLGEQARDRQDADDKEISEHQKAESDENQRDQQEAFDERNKKPGQDDISIDVTLPNEADVEDINVVKTDDPELKNQAGETITPTDEVPGMSSGTGVGK